MARKTQALSFLPFTLTQGGADAFVQASISTALTGQTKVAYRMASLEVELPLYIATAVNDMQFSITRKSFAAFPTSMILEKSMIHYYRRNVHVATAVGFEINDRVMTWRWSDDDAPIIVEDPLYAQLDSASTGLTSVLYGRIGYWLDTISEVDKLTLVANSLS